MLLIFNAKSNDFLQASWLQKNFTYTRSTKSDYYYIPAAAAVALIIYLKIMYPMGMDWRLWDNGI